MIFTAAKIIKTIAVGSAIVASAGLCVMYRNTRADWNEEKRKALASFDSIASGFTCQNFIPVDLNLPGQ